MPCLWLGAGEKAGGQKGLEILICSIKTFP